MHTERKLPVAFLSISLCILIMLLTSCTSNTNDKSYATPKVVNHFGEKAKELDRKCEDINQLNIANQLISAAKMIFELRTKGDNYGELSQYYYDNPDIVKTEIDIQLITTSQKDNTGVVWVQYSARYYNQQNNLIQGSSEVISRWEIEKVNQKWIVTDIDDLP